MQSKPDFTIYLKYFIFPFTSLILIIVIYVLLILPYLNTKYELDTTRESKNSQIVTYEQKLAILKDADAKKEELSSYQQKLIKLVPNEDSPAPLVAHLDAKANEYNFSRIEDNKNIADKNLFEKGYIEAMFNGRTVGPLSALNFITALNSNREKIINIRDLELYDDRDNKYYRVSFVARTIFNKTVSVVSIDTPVVDILNNEKFINFMKNYE